MGICARTDKLSRKNELRIFVLSEKVMFLNSMMCSANSVIMSVVEVFIHSVECSKLCNFACVSPYDSKTKIKRRVSAKYATSICELIEILNSRDIPVTDDICVRV